MQIHGYMGSGLNTFISRFGTSQNSSLFGGDAYGLNVRQISGNNASSDDTSGISQTFAQDIINRISTQVAPEDEAATKTEQLEEGAEATLEQETATAPPDSESTEPKDTTSIEHSLAEAVDFVRANFGDAAAQATMGLIYKNVGTEEITEDSLGEGLLDALKFVDRNFGMAAGDKLMAHFNQGVNNALNDYFDNGLMETFYAANSATGTAGTAQQGQTLMQNTTLSAAMQDLAKQYGGDVATSIMDSLEAAMQETNSPTKALRMTVEQAGVDMAAQYGGEAENHQALIGQSLAPLLHGNSFNSLMPHGSQLDIRV